MEEDFEKFYNSALRFLSYRPRSEKEVRDHIKFKIQKSKVKVATQNSKLETKDDIEFLIDKVIQKLKEQKYVNDEEFAKWWIESRLRFRPRSLRLIKMELKQKGVSDEIIEERIGNQESGMNNELEQAKKLVEKRMTRFRNKFGMTRSELYQKFGRFLASKGFDWDTIKQSIDEAITKVV